MEDNILIHDKWGFIPCIEDLLYWIFIFQFPILLKASRCLNVLYSALNTFKVNLTISRWKLIIIINSSTIISDTWCHTFSSEPSWNKFSDISRCKKVWKMLVHNTTCSRALGMPVSCSEVLDPVVQFPQWWMLFLSLALKIKYITWERVLMGNLCVMALNKVVKSKPEMLQMLFLKLILFNLFKIEIEFRTTPNIEIKIEINLVI